MDSPLLYLMALRSIQYQRRLRYCHFPFRSLMHLCTITYELEEMADDAVAVLDWGGVDRAHVMGASNGWLHCPARGPAAPRAGPVADPGLHGVQQPPVATGAAERVGCHRQRARVWARWPSGPAHWVMGPPLGAEVLARGRDGSARWRWACPFTPSPRRSGPSSTCRSRWPTSLATVAAPTLAVVGNQDILTPRWRQRGAGRAHPGGRAGRDLGCGTRTDD